MEDEAKQGGVAAAVPHVHVLAGCDNGSTCKRDPRKKAVQDCWGQSRLHGMQPIFLPQLLRLLWLLVPVRQWGWGRPQLLHHCIERFRMNAVVYAPTASLPYR